MIAGLLLCQQILFPGDPRPPLRLKLQSVMSVSIVGPKSELVQVVPHVGECGLGQSVRQEPERAEITIDITGADYAKLDCLARVLKNDTAPPHDGGQKSR